MNYSIDFWCASHVGCVRKINQDNYICSGKTAKESTECDCTLLVGTKTIVSPLLFGVFDGMGGLANGEVASGIAAQNALNLAVSDNPNTELQEFCRQTSNQIYTYGLNHGSSPMGTTAAMLAFTRDGVAICNIGDSKIFRFRKGNIIQISEDHLAVVPYGMKPPLSQYLGSPPDKTRIDPHCVQEMYYHNDFYLICSDGLTDMISTEDIGNIIAHIPPGDVVGELLERALQEGGQDNITIILCQIRRKFTSPVLRDKTRKKGCFAWRRNK